MLEKDLTSNSCPALSRLISSNPSVNKRNNKNVYLFLYFSSAHVVPVHVYHTLRGETHPLTSLPITPTMTGCLFSVTAAHMLADVTSQSSKYEMGLFAISSLRFACVSSKDLWGSCVPVNAVTSNGREDPNTGVST